MIQPDFIDEFGCLSFQFRTTKYHPLVKKDMRYQLINIFFVFISSRDNMANLMT